MEWSLHYRGHVLQPPVDSRAHRRGCAIHSLCSYNADFDGDEINVHFPQVCPIGSGVLGVLGEWFVHE
jgi:hypothetical protein